MVILVGNQNMLNSYCSSCLINNIPQPIKYIYRLNSLSRLRLCKIVIISNNY